MHRTLTVKELPNELLVLVLQFCEGRDILSFSEAIQCPEIDCLVANKALWRTPTVGPENLRRYLKYFGPQTTELTILGFVKLKPQSFKPSKQVWEKSEHLPDSVIASIRLRCPNLTTLNLHNCVIDTEKVKFSLFPKTLKHLKLSKVALLNLPQVRAAVTSSPFFCIKKALPQLETLFLENPWYLTPCDSLAIISGCKLNPSLSILGSDHHYTFNGDTLALSRGARRNTSKHFLDLIDYHFVKNRYSTRRGRPQPQ